MALPVAVRTPGASGRKPGVGHGEACFPAEHRPVADVCQPPLVPRYGCQTRLNSKRSASFRRSFVEAMGRMTMLVTKAEEDQRWRIMP